MHVAWDSLFASVDHRVAGSFDGARSLTRPLPSPENDFVSLIMADRHSFAQTHKSFMEVGLEIENAVIPRYNGSEANRDPPMVDIQV